MKKIILTITTLLTAILVTSCGNTNNIPYTFTGLYFDTAVNITIYDSVNNSINQELINICNKYDLLFSTDNPDSEIYKINNSECSETLIDSELYYLLEESINYAQISDGLLDPTIESVSQLWTFESGQIPPAINDIQNKLPSVDYHNIQLSNNNNNYYVKLNNADTKINLGYIAKGYIADKIKELLISKNINNAVINLGGNIVCMGHKNHNENFNIGIQTPFKNTTEMTINCSNLSIVTSGVYERYFNYNDNIYHHILDTHTGYPINNDIYSVTVIGPSSMTCDALSTLLFILGEENGIKYINTLSEYEAMYIKSDYSHVFSDNFPAS